MSNIGAGAGLWSKWTIAQQPIILKRDNEPVDVVLVKKILHVCPSTIFIHSSPALHNSSRSSSRGDALVHLEISVIQTPAMQHESSLRAITNRLTTTPVQDLPRIVGFLASCLAQCPLELQFSDPKGATHKLKARVTSLLQDRSVNGRLSAAVIVKAVIDHGGPNVLANSDGWARGLLNCLNKPDPVEVKQLYLVTVCRIFIRTQNHASLLREITTPLIAPFLTACLALVKPVNLQTNSGSTAVHSPLLESVLQCWLKLLPRHATVFRPFLPRIKLLCQGVLGDGGCSISTRNLATKLLCLLLSSAPKNVLSQEWAQTASSIINSAHQTADKLFRAVLEEYEPNDSARQRAPGKHDFSKEPKISGADSLGLGPWHGIYDGAGRMAVLIAWLEGLVTTSTLQHVSAPLGAILDLTARVFTVAVPANSSSTSVGLRFHKEASREEREELLMNLPRLHISCLGLLRQLHTTYGQSTLAVQQTIASQILDLFEVMAWHDDVRKEVYTLFCDVLRSTDIQFLTLKSTALSTLFDRCCQDLRNGTPSLESQVKRDTSTGVQLPGGMSTGSVAGKDTMEYHNTAFRSEVFQAAWRFLPEALAHCPSSLVPRQSRIEMDRLSVILDHRDAMVVSVMRPMFSDKTKVAATSLLPFLARSAPDALVVETLLRPRMPVAYADETSARKSRDSRLGADDTERVLLGQDGDILSQLENPVNEIQTESGEAGEDLGQPNGLDSPPDDLSRPDEPTKKRGFHEFDDGHVHQEDPRSPEESLSREAKLPRLEEESFVRTIPPSTEVMDEHDIDEDEVALTSTNNIDMVKQSTGKPSIPSVVSTSATRETGNEDSDSSDFEIPTIDPGLDTEDEDDE